MLRLPLAQHTLARLYIDAYCSRNLKSESAIRAISDFKDEGLIEINSGKIKIKQPVNPDKVVPRNVVRYYDKLQ